MRATHLVPQREPMMFEKSNDLMKATHLVPPRD